jgi:hypothetical protein
VRVRKLIARNRFWSWDDFSEVEEKWRRGGGEVEGEGEGEGEVEVKEESGRPIHPSIRYKISDQTSQQQTPRWKYHEAS